MIKNQPLVVKFCSFSILFFLLSAASCEKDGEGESLEAQSENQSEQSSSYNSDEEAATEINSDQTDSSDF